MERVTLREILEKTDGVRREGGGEPAVFTAADSVEVTLMVDGGAEVIAVERVVRLELGGGHVAVATMRGEQFYLPNERVIGLRVAPLDAKGRVPGAGFR